MPTIEIPLGSISVEIDFSDAQAQTILNQLANAAGASEGEVLTKDANGNVVFAAPQGGGEGSNSASYSGNFTNSSLVSGVLTINHNLNHKYVHITIFDNNDKIIHPDFAVAVDANNCVIHLGSFGNLTGTWNFIITQ